MDTLIPPRPSAPRRLPGRRLARLRSVAGFTVAEVMMATFVMIFGISSSILVLQSGFRSLDTARKNTLAAQIMQSEMERIRMLNWTQIQALPASEPIDLNTIFPQNTSVEIALFNHISATFTRVRTTRTLPDTNDEIREISVLITWKGVDGATHRRNSSTQYCKNGLYAYYYRTP